MSEIQTCRLAGACFVFVILTGGAVSAADAKPEDVLKGRGLKKSGSIYVLEGEADFLKKLARVQPLYDQMTNAYSKLDAIVRNQNEYDAMDVQYKLLTERLRNVQAEIEAHPPLSNNELRQNWYDLLEAEKQLRFQRNGLDRELDLRWKTFVSESQRDKLFDEFQKLRRDFLTESRDLRALSESVSANYDRLAKDDAVKKALSALRAATKARVELGPSPEFKRKSALLRNAEKAFSPESLTPKQKARSGRGGRRNAPSSSAKSSPHPK
jgi:hypothetical protein